jgi:transmembrane sensor
MSQAEFKKLLDRYAEGRCTPEEAAIVEKWYDNIGMTEVSESSLHQMEGKMWASVKPTRPIGQTRFYLRIAAAIVLIAVAFAALFFNRQEPAGPGEVVTTTNTSGNMLQLTNNSATIQTVALSDGSTVSLEPNSTLRYPERFNASHRTVELSGEAFFKVSKDRSRPFMVYSNEIVTKVLGTSFRIVAFNDSREIVVAVRTGRVSVSQNPKKENLKKTILKDVILTPNQQLVYKRDEELVKKEIVEAPAGVSADSSYYFMQFDGMSVVEIFEALEENYGIDIQFDADVLKGCVLTTRMKEEGFHERIDVICKAINAEYSTVDGAIVITSDGCQ